MARGARGEGGAPCSPRPEPVGLFRAPGRLRGEVERRLERGTREGQDLLEVLVRERSGLVVAAQQVHELSLALELERRLHLRKCHLHRFQLGQLCLHRRILVQYQQQRLDCSKCHQHRMVHHRSHLSRSRRRLHFQRQIRTYHGHTRFLLLFLLLLFEYHNMLLL